MSPYLYSTGYLVGLVKIGLYIEVNIVRHLKAIAFSRSPNAFGGHLVNYLTIIPSSLVDFPAKITPPPLPHPRSQNWPLQGNIFTIYIKTFVFARLQETVWKKASIFMHM